MIPLYGIFYMVSFMLVERSDVKIHIIHSLADDKIPFCPYFIIPYVMWYFFLIGTVVYFVLFCPGKKEYYQYIGTLAVGMTLFILVSYVYPNGQNLRPDLTGESGIFISAVRFLYKIDTPTNIFPSIHVFNSVASCVALFQNERCRKNKVFTAAQTVLTVSIIMATMFLKQHCVSDVMTALILNILCYQLFYRVIPARQEKLAEVFTRKEILTVPNLLSLIRLGLAILFLGICERHGMRGNRPALTMIILAAAATDFLDGRIARSFNQISRIGRLLDPLADKAMQAVSDITLSAGETCDDPVCDKRNIHAGRRLESHYGDRRDRGSSVAWQAEYSSYLCSCDDFDSRSQTSVFDSQCADRGLCCVHDDVLRNVRG